MARPPTHSFRRTDESPSQRRNALVSVCARAHPGGEARIISPKVEPHGVKRHPAPVGVVAAAGGKPDVEIPIRGTETVYPNQTKPLVFTRTAYIRSARRKHRPPVCRTPSTFPTPCARVKTQFCVSTWIDSMRWLRHIHQSRLCGSKMVHPRQHTFQ